MMHVARILVEGTSEAGPFRGVLELDQGVQVVSGPNRFGKSTAFAAIAWCIGVEQIFGVQASDNAIFPVAPRHLIDLGEALDARVLESTAEIELVRGDGDRLKLRRAIVGATNRISFSNGQVEGDLVVGYGSMKDSTAGFQTTFRQWAGLPEARLMTTKGVETPIYLENLAPLFLIEQLSGWTDLQAEQVYRYGLQDIADGAFEYLLGLDETLSARLCRQKSAVTAASLKQEARAIASDFEALLNSEGWSGELAVVSSIRDLAERWQPLNLIEWVKERFHFDGTVEAQRIAKRVVALQRKLTKGKPDTESTADVTAVSAAVVGLKERRHELQLRMGTLRAQLGEQERVLETVRARHKSARDLVRLKKEGLGILPKAECPTCHQTVDPAHLELNEQSVESVEIHAAQLDHQRQLLANNVELIRKEVIEINAQATRLDGDFVAAEHALRMVNQTVGPARETLVKAHTDLLAAEREMDRVRRIQHSLVTTQKRIKDWVHRAQGVGESDDVVADGALLRQFIVRLRELLLVLDCAGVAEKDLLAIDVDEHYVPILRGRWLRSFGSASDRARLITAYVLSLAAVGRHHPGFVVLDEPLQQNPDPEHRRLFLEFLRTQGMGIQQQAIIFTALNDDEVSQLRETGLAVHVVQGKFLKMKSPDEDAVEGGSESDPDSEVFETDDEER